VGANERPDEEEDPGKESRKKIIEEEEPSPRKAAKKKTSFHPEWKKFKTRGKAKKVLLQAGKHAGTWQGEGGHCPQSGLTRMARREGSEEACPL